VDGHVSDPSSAIVEQVLRSLGVDGVCVRVYLAMYSTPKASIESLAALLDLDPPEVVDAVDALSGLSLLRPGVDPSSGPRPVSYERAIQTLLRQHAEQLSLQRESLEMLQTSMKELLASPRALEGSSKGIEVEAVSGTDAIQQLFDKEALRANRTFVAISPSTPAPKEVLEAAQPLDEELITRGVDTRIIYHYSVLADTRNLQYARWFASIGAQVRRAPVLPPRYMLADQHVAYIPAAHVRPARQALLVRDPTIVALLVELFEATWAAAEPLDGPKSTGSGDRMPSSQEIALLRILAAGSTDDAAAKKLGVSVRTVRRIMADLMERLGATSRFEAGHRATQRGWL
jgi:DNA-binding CsgD family transcriptional regulator